MTIQFNNQGAGNVTLKSNTGGSVRLQFPTAIGTEGQFIITNGFGGLTFTSSTRPTLTGFTTSISNTGAFSTVNRSQLNPATTNANTSIAIAIKGSGGLITCIPDGTTLGGDSRGFQSNIDLQLPGQRTASTQIASSSFSYIFGGYANTASGTNGVMGGTTNTTGVSSLSVVMGGANNTDTSVAQYAVTLGGNYNFLDALRGVIVGGFASSTFQNSWVTVYGSSNWGSTTTKGMAQTRYMCLAQTPTSASQFQFTNTGFGTAGITSAVVASFPNIPINSAVLVRSFVAQRRNTTAGNQVYHGLGLWRRGASGSPTNILNSNTTYASSGTVTSWSFQVGLVNTASNTVAAVVTSTAAVTSYATAYMQILDVGYT